MVWECGKCPCGFSIFPHPFLFTFFLLIMPPVVYNMLWAFADQVIDASFPGYKIQYRQHRYNKDLRKAAVKSPCKRILVPLGYAISIPADENNEFAGRASSEKLPGLSAAGLIFATQYRKV
jgi:hypothetical protein